MEKILDFLEKPGEIFHYFSQFLPEKRQLIMEKNKKWGFFFTCTVFMKFRHHIPEVVAYKHHFAKDIQFNS